MFKKTVTVLGFTLMNVRYASLILPCGVVAYLLHWDLLAITAGILLAAAFAAEIALSIANGFETEQQIKMHKQMRAEDEQLLNSFLTEVDEFRKAHSDGSEGEHAESEGDPGREAWKREDPPGEGQAGVGR